MMKGGLLKTALSASLLMHAAVFLFIAYGPWGRAVPFHSAEGATEPMITIVALPEEWAEPVSEPAPAKPAKELPQSVPKFTPELLGVKSSEVEPTPMRTPEKLIAAPPNPMPPVLATTVPVPMAEMMKASNTERIKDGGGGVEPGESPATTHDGKAVLTIAQPNYRKNPHPVYPSAARQRHQQGLVIVMAEVSTQGHVEKMKLKQSSGFELLDAAAMKAVRKWEFEPARVGDQVLVSQVEVPIQFQLSNGL
jgi:periplasmic protein TonB